MSRATSLPVDSEERKRIPLLSGCLNYFPAALVGVARWSVVGNDKHNKGQELHHARGKSMDHGDCIIRHSMDLSDLMARKVVFTDAEKKAILDEVDARSWRALADSQRIHEMFGAPLAPAAKLAEPVSILAGAGVLLSEGVRKHQFPELSARVGYGRGLQSPIEAQEDKRIAAMNARVAENEKNATDYALERGD